MRLNLPPGYLEVVGGLVRNSAKILWIGLRSAVRRRVKVDRDSPSNILNI
jgi:hypothetical protein